MVLMVALEHLEPPDLMVSLVQLDPLASQGLLEDLESQAILENKELL